MRLIEKIIEQINNRIEKHNKKISFFTDAGVFQEADNTARKINELVEARRIVEEVAAEYNNGWILVSERLPNEKECRKDNGNFIVQSDMGERFSCEFDSLANGYDNPRWACNVWIVAWQPLPEPYKEGKE